MATNDRLIKASPLRVNGYEFEAVDEIKYFGTIVTCKNDINTEIDSHLAMTN